MEVRHVKSVSDFHRFRHLSKPVHPLISLVDYSLVAHHPEDNHINWVQDFYSIGFKKNIPGKYRYGQQAYDFDEGLMSFFAPGQVLNVATTDEVPAIPPSGWILIFHPDFLWNTSLAQSITAYEFFQYDVTESLFLSDKEEQVLLTIFQNIQQEIEANIDHFSQDIIISQIELLLHYANRFYNRQFITRKKSHHQLLSQLEKYLQEYFNAPDLETKGLPTVQGIAETLNVSPNYLSSVLKSLTGLNTRQHMHQKLIEKAKEKLSTTELSVSEIAYALGFEHVQSFSKLFKTKTKLSPVAFRDQFQ